MKGIDEDGRVVGDGQIVDRETLDRIDALEREVGMNRRLGPPYESDEEMQRRVSKYADELIEKVRKAMSVRAKFTVQSVKCSVATPDHSFDVELIAVADGSEENKQFFKWTPSGQIKLSTINAAAGEQFEVGKSYYVDFTKAE